MADPVEPVVRKEGCMFNEMMCRSISLVTKTQEGNNNSYSDDYSDVARLISWAGFKRVYVFS